MQKTTVAIIGAGSIGCLVGSALACQGMNVHFLGRAAKGEVLRKSGMAYCLLNGESNTVDTLNWAAETASLPPADFYLVCVKSQDTLAVAKDLAAYLPDNAHIVSLQNGLDNADMLKAALPFANIHSGMVAFNVVESPIGTFSITTEGDIYCDNDDALRPLKLALDKAGIQTHLRNDMESVQFSKLMLNLNNALNALSGIPLAQQVSDRRWRRVLAAMMDEAKAVGRKSEVDHLNGKIVSLAQRHGVSAPVNAATVAAVHDLFDGKSKSVDPDNLLGA